jgi:hypothetical protein
VAVWCWHLLVSRSGRAVVVQAEAQVAEPAEAVAAAAQVELAEAGRAQAAGAAAQEEQAVPVEREPGAAEAQVAPVVRPAARLVAAAVETPAIVGDIPAITTTI